MTTREQTPAVAGGKTESGGATADGVSPALALLAGWLVPGAGHLLLRKWFRAGLLLLSVGCMFAIGIALKGKVYSTGTGDPLDLLGALGDLGSGLLYLLARLMGWGQAPVLTAVQDYGTKFIVVAGLLNVIAAVDAHSLASGRKRL